MVKNRDNNFIIEDGKVSGEVRNDQALVLRNNNNDVVLG
jgi:hypothetical protein